jgi:hypothetical protein
MTTEKNYAMPFWLMSDQDHSLIVSKMCNNVSYTHQTVLSYLRTFRIANQALRRHNPLLVEPPLAERFTPEAVAIVSGALQEHLRSPDCIHALAELRRTIQELTDVRSAALSTEINTLRERVKHVPPEPAQRVRGSLSVPDDDTMPSEYKEALGLLNSARREDGKPLGEGTRKAYGGQVRIWLKCLEENGVDWRASSLRELVRNPDYFRFFVRHSDGPSKGADRLNALACALTLMVPGEKLGAAFSLAAELRAQCPGSNASKGRGVKRSGSDIAVQPEDAARLKFALQPGPRDKFHFEGRTISLNKRTASDATGSNIKRSLLMMTALLSEFGPEMLALPTEQRDYRFVANLFLEAYKDYPAVTLVTRMDHFRSLLIRILPPTYDSRWLNELIRELREAIPEHEISAPPVSSRHLLLTSIGTFKTTVARLRELVLCQHPYVSPKTFALDCRDLAISVLLADEPLRRRTLHKLDRKHIKPTSFENANRYLLSLEAELMKSGKPHVALLRKELTEVIDDYINFVRLCISGSCGDDQDAPMWVTDRGNRLSYARIGVAIPYMMQRVLGTPISLHAFRRIKATYVGNATLARIALANSERIVNRHYRDSSLASEDVIETSLAKLSSIVLDDVLSDVLDGTKIDDFDSDIEMREPLLTFSE